MALLDFLKRKPKVWAYTPQEQDLFEAHVTSCLGPVHRVLHEIVSADIHLDILVIGPNDQLPFIKLVTMGMGARPMQVPQNLKDKQIDRVELIQFLPADWDLTSQQAEHFWPVDNLSMLARLPIHHQTWLGYGHTVACRNGESFASNTKLNSSFLLSSPSFPKYSFPDGKVISFLQVIPLYQEETDFKLSNSTHALLERLQAHSISTVVDIQRINTCI